jgi:RNA polymerase sigma-70 factor (ECF subfamily)
MEGRAWFEQLYEAHAGAVLTYARRRSDAQTAEDVVAEVFLVAWRKLGEVPKSDPLPWLLAVARRTLANRRRTGVRESALRGRLRFDRSVQALAPQSGSSLDNTVLVALGRLSEQDRETLLLVAWEGLTPAQAAAVVGVAPNTFSARLSRARRRFERAFGARGAIAASAAEPTSTEL